MPKIANVAPDELIESATFGNPVVDTVNGITLRRRFLATRASPQALNVGAFTTVSVPSVGENSAGLAPGPPVSVPVAVEGPYIVTFRCQLTASAVNQSLRINLNAAEYTAPMASNARGSITVSGYLSAGTTIVAQVFTPSAASVDLAQLEILPLVQPQWSA